MKSMYGLLDDRIEGLEKMKTCLEERMKMWQDPLNDPLVLEFHRVEIEILKLDILFCKNAGINSVLFEMIRKKFKEKLVKQQEIIESISEKGLISEGLFLIACEKNKQNYEAICYSETRV